jgi:hypothetical protein
VQEASFASASPPRARLKVRPQALRAIGVLGKAATPRPVSIVAPPFRAAHASGSDAIFRVIVEKNGVVVVDTQSARGRIVAVADRRATQVVLSRYQAVRVLGASNSDARADGRAAQHDTARHDRRPAPALQRAASMNRRTAPLIRASGGRARPADVSGAESPRAMPDDARRGLDAAVAAPRPGGRLVFLLDNRRALVCAADAEPSPLRA